MLSVFQRFNFPRYARNGSKQVQFENSTKRSYAAAAKQGTKRKPGKRKLKDMPGYKERMERARQDAEPEGKFIRLFGPDATLPSVPPEAAAKMQKSELFPGEEDVPKETEIMIGELDREFERMKGKAAIVLQDPDYIIFDSLVQYRVQELELQWLYDPSPITKEGNAALQKKIDEEIFNTTEEFRTYFRQRSGMTNLQLRKARQFFLNEMGGRIHFFHQDKWKLQLIDPKYDLEKNPLSMKERIKLFKTPTEKLAANPSLLYKQYRELAMVVDPGAKDVALPTERILAHFEMRQRKKKVAEMEKKDLEAELEQMEFETDMLMNASEDSRADEGDFTPDYWFDSQDKD